MSKLLWKSREFTKIEDKTPFKEDLDVLNTLSPNYPSYLHLVSNFIAQIHQLTAYYSESHNGIICPALQNRGYQR